MDAAECFVIVGYLTGGIGLYSAQDCSLIQWIQEHHSRINSFICTAQVNVISENLYCERDSVRKMMSLVNHG